MNFDCHDCKKYPVADTGQCIDCLEAEEWAKDFEKETERRLMQKANEVRMYQQKVAAINAKISAERVTLNSHMSGLTTIFANDPDYKAATQASIAASQMKISELQMEIQQLTRDIDDILKKAAIRSKS